MIPSLTVYLIFSCCLLARSVPQCLTEKANEAATASHTGCYWSKLMVILVNFWPLIVEKLSSDMGRVLIQIKYGFICPRMAFPSVDDLFTCFFFHFLENWYVIQTICYNVIICCIIGPFIWTTCYVRCLTKLINNNIIITLIYLVLVTH